MAYIIILRLQQDPCFTSTGKNQAALELLMGFFVKVVIHTNTNNMVGMICQPCYMVVRHLEEDYKRQMIGLG